MIFKDHNYFRDVTLDSVMTDYRNIFVSLHTNKIARPKGSVMLVATPPPEGKNFQNSSRRAVGSVASKDINLSIVSQDLRMHTRSQGLWPMRRHLLPLHPHPELSSPVPTARKLDIPKNRVTRRRMMKGNQMIQLLLFLWSLNMGSLPLVTHSPTTLLFLIQELLATCAALWKVCFI
jgi:hypothetical protein